LHGTWYGLLVIISLRYFLIAGAAYLLWYKLLKKRLFYKKIQQRLPASTDLQREIGYSLITIIVFAAVPVLMLQSSFVQYTLYYRNISTHTLTYFWLAFRGMFIIHDTYFYWKDAPFYLLNIVLGRQGFVFYSDCI
jgi:lathosterol oxidase